MTDDNDRTQEIRRDGDQYRPAAQGDSTPPSAYRPQQPPQQNDAYPPAGGGYRPAGPAQGSYGEPVLPMDRGSGGFPAAVIGAVVATLIAVATSFAGYQILKSHPSIDARKLPGFVTYRLNMLSWPSGRGGDVTTAFVVGVLIVLVVTLLLMMAAAMSTRAGTGGFGLFLAAWMSTVIAGGIARPVAGAIARNGSFASNTIWQDDLNVGVVWGVLFGWIAALLLVIVHALRRKPVTR